MAKRTFAVLGATGHTGRVVAEELLGRGHEVRAVGRDRGRLEALARLGARPYPVDADHPVHGLVEAFRGADAVYALIPSAFDEAEYLAFEKRVGANIEAALRQAETRHVVNLSALGADLRFNSGYLLGLHKHERRLEGIPGIHVLHLRPSFFMEELLAWIPRIRGDRVGCLFQYDLALELIATADVGRRAADLLERLDFEGHDVLELSGPRAYPMHEIARLLGQAIGQPDLGYQQVDEETEQKALLARGFTLNGVALYVETEHAINEGRVRFHGTPYRGPTTLERFAAETFAPAYRAR